MSLEIKVKDCVLDKEKFSGLISFSIEMEKILSGDYSRGHVGVIEDIKRDISNKVYEEYMTKERVSELIDRIDIEDIARTVRHRIIRENLK
mgnify:CR=1 FL=1